MRVLDLDQNVIREHLGMDKKKQPVDRVSQLDPGSPTSPGRKASIADDDFGYRPPSDDSDTSRNKMSPTEFTKNVLLSCNVLKKPPKQKEILQGGRSILRLAQKNPAYRDTANRTFYGRKLSEANALVPAPYQSTESIRNVPFESGRASSLKMGKRDVNSEVQTLLMQQEAGRFSNRRQNGPPYLPGEVERRAFGQLEPQSTKGLMFTTASGIWEMQEKKEIFHY